MSNKTTSSSTPEPSFEDSIEEIINRYISSSVLLLFSVVLFILCLLFQNHQPLKSRANLPLLGSLCLIATSIYSLLLNLLKHVGVVQGVTNTWMSGAGFGLTGVFAALILLQAVQIIRFLLLQNANFQRLKLVKFSTARNATSAEENANALVLRKISTYKKLLSPYIPPATLAVALVVLIPLFSLGYYLDVVSNNSFRAGRFVSSVGSYAAIYLVILIVCIVDMAQNSRNLCPIHQFFVRKDRLIFRIEALFGVLAVTFYAFVMTLRGAGNSAIARGGQGVYVVIMVLDILRQVFFSIYVGGGIPLAAVLISRMRGYQQGGRWSRNSKSIKQGDADNSANSKPNEEEVSNADLMNALLGDEQGLKLFEEYVQAEYSIENLECWKVIQLLKAECRESSSNATSITSSQAQRKLMSQLHDTFVQTGSPLQVNITAETRVEFESMLLEMNLQTVVSESPSSTVAPQTWTLDERKLENFEGSVLLNLSDSFMRLKQTAEYFQFLKGVEAKKNMLHALNFS